MAGDQRADDCAKAVQPPVAGAGRDALAEPARDESTMKTMCGTRATALRPYWTSRARIAGEAWSCFA
jgi:hypothetical protein